jgi:lysophospholipase L1-like esterase
MPPSRGPSLPLLLLLALATPSCSLLIPVTDPALAFSRYNWALDASGSSAAASNPGASLKFAFSGSSSVALQLNTSALASAGGGKFCLVLSFSVDDGPWAFALPEGGQASGALPLAAGLAPGSAQHDVRLFLYASCEGKDRWLQQPLAAGGSSFLVLQGVLLQEGASVQRPPLLRRGSALVYGDSISEGTNAQNYDLGAGRCGGPYGLAVSASTDSWAFAFAEAMGAELSLAAFAAQGYATRNSLNYGNVPPLLALNGSSSEPPGSAWDRVCEGFSRLPELAAQPPTYLVNALGFNDQNSDVTSALLQATVAAWLPAARAAVGPSTSLLLAIPFGGALRTGNATRLAILAGFAQYKASAAGSRDACALALDLFPAAQRGLQGLGSPTAESCDGTHPLAKRHAQLGSMLAAAAVQALDAAPAQCARADRG